MFPHKSYTIGKALVEAQVREPFDTDGWNQRMGDDNAAHEVEEPVTGARSFEQDIVPELRDYPYSAER